MCCTVQQRPFVHRWRLCSQPFVHQIGKCHHGVGIAEGDALLEDCDGARHVFLIVDQIAAEIVERRRVS